MGNSPQWFRAKSQIADRAYSPEIALLGSGLLVLTSTRGSRHLSVLRAAGTLEEHGQEIEMHMSASAHLTAIPLLSQDPRV
jgi:hypothetical protein